jgi:DNA polymerase V
MGICPKSPIQQYLFDITAEQIGKIKRLDKVADCFNKCFGSEIIVIGAHQYTRPNGECKAEVFANAIKHDFKSKKPPPLE